jgi:hypothetical protein
LLGKEIPELTPEDRQIIIGSAKIAHDRLMADKMFVHVRSSKPRPTSNPKSKSKGGKKR